MKNPEGRYRGKITVFGTNRSIKCDMHKGCSKLFNERRVSGAVGEWFIARGQDPDMDTRKHRMLLDLLPDVARGATVRIE